MRRLVLLVGAFAIVVLAWSPPAHAVPEFALSASTARPGDSIVVTGSGWDPASGDIAFFLDTPESAEPTRELARAIVRDDGTFSDEFVVPDVFPTKYAVYACQGCATLPAEFFGPGTTLVVEEATPLIVLDRERARPGAMLTARGSGWHDYAGPVTIGLQSLDDSGFLVILVEQGPDAYTLFTAGFPVPDVAAGDYSVLACQSCDDSEGFVGATTGLQMMPSPTLTVTPSTAGPGTTVRIEGTGWLAEDGPVTLFPSEAAAQDPGLAIGSVDPDAADSFAESSDLASALEPGSFDLFACQGCLEGRGSLPGVTTALVVTVAAASTPASTPTPIAASSTPATQPTDPDTASTAASTPGSSEAESPGGDTGVVIAIAIAIAALVVVAAVAAAAAAIVRNRRRARVRRTATVRPDFVPHPDRTARTTTGPPRGLDLPAVRLRPLPDNLARVRLLEVNNEHGS